MTGRAPLVWRTRKRPPENRPVCEPVALVALVRRTVPSAGVDLGAERELPGVVERDRAAAVGRADEHGAAGGGDGDGAMQLGPAGGGEAAAHRIGGVGADGAEVGGRAELPARSVEPAVSYAPMSGAPPLMRGAPSRSVSPARESAMPASSVGEPAAWWKSRAAASAKKGAPTLPPSSVRPPDASRRKAEYATLMGSPLL